MGEVALHRRVARTLISGCTCCICYWSYFSLEAIGKTLTLVFLHFFSIMSTSTSTTTTFPTQDISVSPSASLLKTKLIEFQRVLAVIAFEYITDDVSSTKTRETMARVVLGDEEHDIDSQINMLWQGIDPRYNNLFVPTVGSDLVVSPLYSPNRGTKQLEVGKHLTF